MTYITDEEIAALPEDPSSAFIAAEKILRDRLDEAMSSIFEGSSEHLTLGYMNRVIALAIYFGVQEIAEWDNAVPGHHSWNEYARFQAEVDACTMRMRLGTVRRAKEYSISLDSVTKEKLSHLLAQMREVVEKLDVSQFKKDRIYKRVNALQDEIDRARTGIHAFGALAMDVAVDAGDVGEKVVGLVERIGAALGMAKRDEQASTQLPAPPKRIEGPKRRPAKKSADFDEEIPF